MSRARGQAAIEVCLLLPLVAAAAWWVTTAFAGGVVGVAVEHALDRGVVAAASGRDPVAALRAALPPGLRPGATIRRRGPRLVVVVRPPAGLPRIAGAAVLADP